MLAVSLGLNEYVDVTEPDGTKRLTLVGVGALAVRFVYGTQSHLIRLKDSKRVSRHLAIYPKKRRGQISVGFAAHPSILIVRGDAKCKESPATA